MSKEIITDIETAVNELKSGKILIVIDDEDRENEGDFIMAAEQSMEYGVIDQVIHKRD